MKSMLRNKLINFLKNYWVLILLFVLSFSKILIMNIINEDWEKESDKYFVYLYEQQKITEDLYWEWEESNRKPANIIVLNEKILKKDESIIDIFPF